MIAIKRADPGSGRWLHYIREPRRGRGLTDAGFHRRRAGHRPAIAAYQPDNQRDDQDQRNQRHQEYSEQNECAGLLTDITLHHRVGMTRQVASDRDHVAGDRRVLAQKDASADGHHIALSPFRRPDASTNGDHVSASAFHSNRAADANQAAGAFVFAHGYALTEVDLVSVAGVKHSRRNDDKQ